MVLPFLSSFSFLPESLLRSSFPRASHCIVICHVLQYKSSRRAGRVSRSLFQCLDVRVLVDLGGAQWVSSVDCGGWRSTDIGLMGKLSLVLTRVDGGRGQNPRAHADGDLVDDAGGVGGVLHGVPCRPLGGHQVRDGARGAQGGWGGVCVEVGLGGQVSSGSRGQVRMNCTVAGTIVRERVRGLSYRWSDVGLLSPVTPCAISRDVLLGLDKDSNSDNWLQDKRWLFTSSVMPGGHPMKRGWLQKSPWLFSWHPQHHHNLSLGTGNGKGSLPSLARPCSLTCSPQWPLNWEQNSPLWVTTCWYSSYGDPASDAWVLRTLPQL